MSGSDVRSRVIPLKKAPLGETVLQHGTLDVKLAAPARPNEQTPHEQDELYIVVRGAGVLFHDGKRDPFAAGHCLFVAAGVAHHLDDHGPDLLVWRVFYGPDGSEV